MLVREESHSSCAIRVRNGMDFAIGTSVRELVDGLAGQTVSGLDGTKKTKVVPVKGKLYNERKVVLLMNEMNEWLNS